MPISYIIAKNNLTKTSFVVIIQLYFNPTAYHR